MQCHPLLGRGEGEEGEEGVEREGAGEGGRVEGGFTGVNYVWWDTLRSYS